MDEPPPASPLPDGFQGILPKDVKRVDAPFFYVGAITLMTTGNDFTLVLSRARPIENSDGTVNTQAVTSDPVAVISVTPQTLKDLFLVLTDVIPQYEAQFGELKTLFMMRRAEAAKTAT
jgi:hypothetical protein